MADRLIIRSGLVPPIYSSGVRYQEEPGYDFGESFDDAWVCTQRGWADCDDLAAWLCAQYQEQGEAAGIRVTWKPHPSVMQKLCAVARQRGYTAEQVLKVLAKFGKLYHVTVRRADGSIECPSTKLGMPTGEEFTRGKRRPHFGLALSP